MLSAPNILTKIGKSVPIKINIDCLEKNPEFLNEYLNK